MIEEGVPEEPKRVEIVERASVEVKPLEVFQRFFDAACHQEVAVRGKLPDEQVECRLAVHAARVIARGHRQLVQVG